MPQDRYILPVVQVKAFATTTPVTQPKWDDDSRFKKFNGAQIDPPDGFSGQTADNGTVYAAVVFGSSDLLSDIRSDPECQKIAGPELPDEAADVAQEAVGDLLQSKRERLGYDADPVTGQELLNHLSGN